MGLGLCGWQFDSVEGCWGHWGCDPYTARGGGALTPFLGACLWRGGVCELVTPPRPLSTFLWVKVASLWRLALMVSYGVNNQKSTKKKTRAGRGPSERFTT